MILAPIMAVAIDFADSEVSNGRRCRNDRRRKLRTDDVDNVLIK